MGLECVLRVFRFSNISIIRIFRLFRLFDIYSSSHMFYLIFKKTDLTNVHTNTDLNKFLMPYIISTKKNLRKIFEMKKYADILICQKNTIAAVITLKKGLFRALSVKMPISRKKRYKFNE